MNKLPFLRATPPKWPDAASQVGAYRGMKGKYRCWELRDRNCEPFKTILDSVCDQLDQYCGRVPKSYLVGYDVFMIGDTPETSVPHIMFHCSKEGPRKEAMIHIKRSGILKEHKGLGVGQWRSPPHLPNISLAARGQQDVSQATKSHVFSLESHLDNGSLAFSDSKPLLFRVDGSDLRSRRTATVSLLVRFAGQLCCLAPAHTFCADADADSSEVSDVDDDSDFEFSAFDDHSLDYSVEDDDDHDRAVDIMSRGSRTPDLDDQRDLDSWAVFDPPTGLRRISSMSSHDSSDYATENELPWSRRPSFDHQATDETFPECLHVAPAFDYAIIPLQPDKVMFFNLIELSGSTFSVIKDKEYHVFFENTSGILVTGILENRPSYMRFPRSQSFEKVYPVSLNGRLRLGDCGVAVRCSASGSILGHVVAGSFESSIAFIMPASRVLADIARVDPETIEPSSQSNLESVFDQHRPRTDLTGLWCGDFRSSPHNASDDASNSDASEVGSCDVKSEELATGLSAPGFYSRYDTVKAGVSRVSGFELDDQAVSEVSFDPSACSNDSGYVSASRRDEPDQPNEHDLIAAGEWSEEEDRDELLHEYWQSAESTLGELSLPKNLDGGPMPSPGLSLEVLKDRPNCRTAFIRRFLTEDMKPFRHTTKNMQHQRQHRFNNNGYTFSPSVLAGFKDAKKGIIEEEDEDE